MTIHVVKPGDSLYAISRQYGVSPALLAEFNGLSQPWYLVPGQAIAVVCPERVYQVKKGDSLASIADSFGMGVRELFRNNPQLKGQSGIAPGEEIIISLKGDKLGRLSVNGYAYPFIKPSLLESTVYDLTWLTPFTYGITGEGELVELNDSFLLQVAKDYRTKPQLHLSTLTETGGFDSARAVELLRSPAARKRAISNLTGVVEEKGYMAIDVDFEYIPGDYAMAYADFVQSLRDLGKPVTVALAPKTSAGQPGLLYQGHDYKALGEAADYALLMTYEWGYTYGPPMAVAPLPEVRRVLDFAVSQIPPEKLYMGMPNYGYDWTLPFTPGKSKASSISNDYALELARRFGAEIQFDERAMSPWFNYTDKAGHEHQVWFEDARSTEAKLKLVKEYGFFGAGYWNMMRPFQQGWTVLNAMFDVM